MSVNLRGMTTETRNPHTMELDRMSELEIVTAMNQEDAKVPQAISRCLPQIAQAAAFAVAHGARVRILDRENEITVFTADTITVPPRAGWSLSVLALTDQCTGVSIHGTKYELDQVTVTNTFPIGVSNQWHGEARISVEPGILAILESRM